VVVDQWELFRLGIEHILEELDIRVLATTSRSGEALLNARSGAAELLIVAKSADLRHEIILKRSKSEMPAAKVIFLVDKIESKDVARLVSLGVDGLLLRSVGRTELTEAIDRISEGERLIAPALAATTLGRVGPAMDLSVEEAVERSGLSRKELEVLAVLAEGATYKGIAEALIVTQATVKTHLVHIYSKLGVKNREQAIARALALGILG